MNLPLREQRQEKQPIGPEESHDAHGRADRGDDIQRLDRAATIMVLPITPDRKPSAYKIYRVPTKR